MNSYNWHDGDKNKREGVGQEKLASMQSAVETVQEEVVGVGLGCGEVVSSEVVR